MDKRVVIHGTSRADVNGKCGVATDFHSVDGLSDRTADRYTVRLEGGEEYKLRPANLRVESEGAVGTGVRLKKKGGKKKK